jgi:hypothetical protein
LYVPFAKAYSHSRKGIEAYGRLILDSCRVFAYSADIVSLILSLVVRIMKIRWSLLALCLMLAACADSPTAQFWRPIAEPNLLMNLADAQAKLDYDLSQCGCGIFPKNVPHSLADKFDQDRLRLNQTSVTREEHRGQCLEQPSLLVSECMRARGWEVTKCSGRMPVAGGGAVCAGYIVD